MSSATTGPKDGWTDLLIKMRGHVNGLNRSRFSYPEDTEVDWLVVVPYSGRFSFEIVLDRASTQHPLAEGGISGMCEFGDVIIVPPGVALRRRMISVSSFLFATFQPSMAIPVGRTRFHDLERLSSTLRYLRGDAPAVQRVTGSHELVIAHMIKDLLVTVLWENEYSDPSEDPLMQDAASYIAQHALSPSLSLTVLSHRLGLSPSQLSRRFRSAHGITPIAYARTVRLRRARHLLLETDETLQSVAEQCGFSSAFYLSRVFTQEMGQSPSAYRSRYRI